MYGKISDLTISIYGNCMISILSKNVPGHKNCEKSKNERKNGRQSS